MHSPRFENYFKDNSQRYKRGNTFYRKEKKVLAAFRCSSILHSDKLGSLTDICYRCSQIEKHVVVSTFSTATGGRGCGEEVICHRKVQQSFLLFFYFAFLIS